MTRDQLRAMRDSAPLPPELLELLRCPKCKGHLRLDGDGSALSCPQCRLRYAIREGIPIMLIDQALAF